MERKRQDHEPPMAITAWGWHYHHLGIPTNNPISKEVYLPELKLGVCGFDTCPFGIEWMHFGEDSPVHELIRKVPHLAFEVDDLDRELTKHHFTIITPPNSPSEGVRVAMIEHNGAPIELIEFKKTE
ncbi:MAG: VOC family protein [Bacteroidales bacterium]